MHQSHRCTPSKSPCLHHHLHHHHHHHHLHHHHHHHHHCALHCHPHLRPSFASPIPPQNLQPLASLTSPKDVNPSVSQEPSNSNALGILTIRKIRIFNSPQIDRGTEGSNWNWRNAKCIADMPSDMVFSD
uniref:Uncharacterized protein n=1 Tax=Vitis vinifera TaxID=29760 RepID=F6I7H3_VITVI